MKYSNVLKLSIFILFCSVNTVNADTARYEENGIILEVTPNISYSTTGTFTQYCNLTNTHTVGGKFNTSLRFDENVTMESAFVLRTNTTDPLNITYYWSEVSLDYVYLGGKHYFVAYNANIAAGGSKQFKITYTPLSPQGKWDMILRTDDQDILDIPTTPNSTITIILDPFWGESSDSGDGGSYVGAFIDRPVDGFYYYDYWGINASQMSQSYDVNSTVWQYSREIIVTNSTYSYNYSSYQVSFNISNASASANQFRVVRYTNNTYFEIPSFVQDLNSSHVTVWTIINYSVNPQDYNQTFYVYYGNMSASDRSYEITNVFDADNRELDPVLEFKFSQNNSVAMSLDGTDDYLYDSTLDTTIQSSEDYSASVWVKPDQARADTILSFGSDASGEFLIRITVDATLNPKFQVLDDAVAVRGTITSTISINTAEWSHIVGTYNGTSGDMILYVNGVQAGSATASGITGDSGDLLFVGNGIYEGADGNDEFDGTIDEVKIYNQVLSQAEARSIHVFDSINDSNLFVYLPFESSDGSDESGHENDCTVSGATATGSFVYDSSMDQGDNWQSLYLDGSGDYLTVNPIPSVTSYTISFWINLINGGNDDCIFSQNWGNNGAIYLDIRGATTDDFRYFVKNSTGTQSGGSFGTFTYYSTWTHIVVRLCLGYILINHQIQ
jgi:hypothetical protein